MTPQQPRPLTVDAARSLHRLHGADLAPGLSEQELDVVEARFGFRFAADHRVFLGAGLPLGEGWPNWRDGADSALRDSLERPVEGTLFDVRRNGFWYPEWGGRPEQTEAAVRIATVFLAEVPWLVPVFGHRYLPGIAGQVGHPVLSVHQTDVIYCGADLADYLQHEFTRRPAQLDRAHATVPFWSYLLGETNGIPEPATYTTRYAPYARSAEEALTDLRMLALERALGRRVGADKLIEAGLVALVLDVDSPALRRLAGLGRSEEAEAEELFEQVMEELGLLAGLPAEETEIRWALARWWLTLIAEGAVHPATGADLLRREAWWRLDCPEALRAISDEAVAYEDWIPAFEASLETITARIVAEAARLLAGPWPPLS
ncbi:hypothetical protein [Kitasatospora sp. MMS16-BH015]|uniref:hypothetical protein n=1 Tax=Kitasatospora sp. MMS16-BH015 TaxID=2018025 RepID=UPI0020C26A66|nr:hypothetical protein [Kitasatospora sp. MMS16-BH015]